MGDTFARVQEVKERTGIKERVQMINDFLWVIDLQEEFKGTKYILTVDQLNADGETNANSDKGKLQKLKEQIGNMLTGTEKTLRTKLNELEIFIKKSNQSGFKLSSEVDEFKRLFIKSQK
jgi:hypothetical protein